MMQRGDWHTRTDPVLVSCVLEGPNQLIAVADEGGGLPSSLRKRGRGTRIYPQEIGDALEGAVPGVTTKVLVRNFVIYLPRQKTGVTGVAGVVIGEVD